MRNRRVLIGLVAALLSFPVIAQNSAKNIKKQARNGEYGYIVGYLESKLDIEAETLQ